MPRSQFEAKALADPSGRLSRLARFGGMASNIAGDMWLDGTRQLAQLRGAAMKVGQLLSMDAGDMLPPELAIKIQYPGVRRSIDSDVDNVASLMRLSGVLPKTVNIAPMWAEAKRQLHQ